MALGCSIILPLLLVGCLLQNTTAENVTEPEVQSVSEIVPVTTFKPDPELQHDLDKIIDAADDSNSYDVVEAEMNSKMKKETNVTKTIKDSKPTTMNKKTIATKIDKETNATNITKSSTENPTTIVENSSPTSISSSQPPVTVVTKEATKVEIETTSVLSITSASTEESVSESITDSSKSTSKSASTSPVKKVTRPRPPWWVNNVARPIVFPIFLAISWVFLGFLLVCHLAIPKLKKTSGYPFMFYILALMIKATVTFCNIVFKHHHSPEFCFYAASISYMKSLAMLFWVNIMVFDIWRKSRSLVNFKPAKPVAMWKYHLYGWGTPFSLGIFSLVIEHLVPDESSWIVKPGFDNGYKCWFETGESQLLYLNTPIGILHVFNVIMMVFTYRYVNRITDNAFVDDDQGAPGNTLPRDTAVPAAKRSDFVLEFWFNFWILTFTVVQWVLWMIAQILHHYTGMWQMKVIPGFLIALQGVVLFIIFILNSGKRKVMKQNFPGIFERLNGCWSKVHASQDKLTINKSSTAPEPQIVTGQTNPAFVEDVINVGAHGNIALASMNQTR